MTVKELEYTDVPASDVAVTTKSKLEPYSV